MSNKNNNDNKNDESLKPVRGSNKNPGLIGSLGKAQRSDGNSSKAGISGPVEQTSAVRNEPPKSVRGSKFSFKNKIEPVSKTPEYELDSRPAQGQYIPQPEKIYTDEEIANMKKGHFEVQEDMWEKFTPGTTFVYEDVDGIFHPCYGFVITNKERVFCIGSRTSIKGAYPIVDRKIPYEKISKLYKRYAPTASIEIEMLVNSIKEISKRIKELNSRIDELENRKK